MRLGASRETSCGADPTIAGGYRLALSGGPRQCGPRTRDNGRVRSDLQQFLLDAGASEADIDRAQTEGWLPLLALDRLVSPGHAAYTLADIADLADADADQVRRLWRAVGFPDAPEDLPVFADADAAAARLAIHGRFAQAADFETVLRQARVISASMARVAAVLAESFGDEIHARRGAGVDEETVAWTIVDDFAADELMALLTYVTQLQLRGALWRRLSREAVPDLAVAIGFADLAGYTLLSAELAADDLSEFVGRWEQIAYDTVAQYGSRVIKTIGDEVMFAGLPPQVARTGIALRDAAV